MPISPQPVTIAGGGLAGSLLAVFLARRGFAVSVYERHPDMRKQHVPAGRSINLALADRGLYALSAAGIAARVKPLLISMRGRMLHDARGHLTLQRYGRSESEVIHSISRPGLNEVLIDAAESLGVRFYFSHPCIQADLRAGELIVLDETRNEQRSVPMTPVVAADGAGSVVRRAMSRVAHFHSSEEYLEHSYKELTIPAGPHGEHQLETHALHIWPRGGFMLIALPNLDGSFTVTLFLPTADFAALDTPEKLHNFFSEQFPDTLEHIPDLAQDFFDNPTGALATVRCAPWSVGNAALLIGDAAHAIVPFHGQGMNCAFEDYVELDALLDRHDQWETLFEQFQRLRRPNTEAIADMALENYIEMRDTVRQVKFQLQKALSWELERRHPRRFVPRYSMVMFHHEIPYSEAKRRGVVQQELLDELTREIDELSSVDFRRAEQLVCERLEPLPPRPGQNEEPLTSARA